MWKIHGSCHCGNIGFVLDWPEAGEPIAVRACGRDFCTKHRASWTSRRDAPVALSMADPARARRYRFGTETADFHICTSCGVVPIVTCEIDGAGYAVVNANCFDDVDCAELAGAASNFEGETTVARLARRQRNWSPLRSV